MSGGDDDDDDDDDDDEMVRITFSCVTAITKIERKIMSDIDKLEKTQLLPGTNSDAW